MNVNLDSSSGIKSFPNKQEYDLLKNNLSKMAFYGVQVWINRASYCEETQRGVKDLTSKRVCKMDITLDEKTKRKLSVDFYSDQLLSENVPEDLKEVLKALSKTEQAAHKVLTKGCAKFFDSPESAEFKEVIKKTENIKSLKDSVILKTAAYSVLQENVWDVEARAHLTEKEYLKNWV